MIHRLRRSLHRLRTDDSGQATVETAFALATLISVLMVALGAIAVVATHLSATDAAGHIARAEARGDAAAAASVRGALEEAEVSVDSGGDTVDVTVTMRLSLIDVTGRATALVER
ncbi:TadE family type IV pilus minor pilin [uncultured Corynebacterium sp.]|uniref:TadE family type IV pilus minor pilin n=1 Tax=uncultured Corynebacterium sp. TaxID=159447 RepID=UPI0025EB389C|nr:TadE family type IV pilus minor pilin [uncultured Corynebacterium sp.]